MTEAHGHISVNDRNVSPRFQRFVDEKLRHWMKTHEVPEPGTEYEVAFFDEDILGEVSCLIVLQKGDHMWRSWETGDNARMALNKSLEKLHTETQH